MRIKHMKKTAALLISASLVTGLCVSSVGADDDSADTIVTTAAASDKESIENVLNLMNINPEWTYSPGQWVS